MNTIIERFNKIKSNIALSKPTQKVNIIAVSKTFPLEHLNPLIDYGHLHFGENKVQGQQQNGQASKRIRILIYIWLENFKLTKLKTQ